MYDLIVPDGAHILNLLPWRKSRFSCRCGVFVLSFFRYFAPVAQRIEQRFPKPLVGGSIPPGGAEAQYVVRETPCDHYI